MPLENTVTNSGQILASQIQPSSDWKWTLVSLGFMLLVYSLGKLCIRQDIASNGRVQTRVVLPTLLNSALNLRRSRARRGRSKFPDTTFSRQQRLWCSQLYETQEIVFGVILYGAGLALIVNGSTRLFYAAGYIDNVTPVLLIIAGALLALWGVVTVVRRRRHNPFVSQF